MERFCRLTVTGAALALAAVSAHAQHQGLTGRWELRDGPSADRGREPAAAERPPDPPTGVNRRGRGGLSDEDRRQLGRLLGMAREVPAFTIAQTDSTIVVTNADGFSYTLFPDGRKTTLPLDDNLSVEVRAAWKNGALEVQFKPEGGGTLTESYHLADSALFLRLEVTVEHRRLPRRLWESRMYRRVDPG